MFVVETVAGISGKHGYQDGPISESLFLHPVHLVFDSEGNLYTNEKHWLRKISKGKKVISVAGREYAPKLQLKQIKEEYQPRLDGLCLASDNMNNIWLYDFTLKAMRDINCITKVPIIVDKKDHICQVCLDSQNNVLLLTLEYGGSGKTIF